MSENEKTEAGPQPTVENNTPSPPLLADQVLPPNLFILPVNSPVVFPTLLAPILVNQPRFVAMIEEAINRQRVIGLLLTRTGDPKDDTKPEDLYSQGVAVKIIKRLKMPDGSVNLLVHGMKRFRLKRVLSEQPYIVAETEYLEEIAEKSVEMDALTRTVVSHVKKLSEVNPFFTEEMRLAMINAPGPATVADLVAFALALPKADAQDMLETLTVKDRFEKLLLHLRREQDLADIQKKITEDVNSKINKLQRDFFLKEQLKTIKRELGMEEDGKDKSSRTFRERIVEAKMPPEVEKIAQEELEKFETLSESSPEYNVSRNYLDMLVSLPWSKTTEDNLDLAHARGILDEEHYGLEKVKERIVEFLAVRALRLEAQTARDAKSAAQAAKEKALAEKAPASKNSGEKATVEKTGGALSRNERPMASILCLVGPPGVGKTSVGKSIARTMGRTFFRFSLGGMRDEAEIKGHRRTYVGAMPGKVIQGIRRAGTKNCVLMLDEIDKLGQSFMGDPASALLEVLDPEQNQGFLDHYLDVPFDLSQVLFVTTANSIASIPAPLLDRMEVIELPGYTLEEKEDIASRYVIPRELEANGLKAQQLKIEKAALRQILHDYAREPGLRSLQQLIGRIARKAAAKIVGDRKTKPITVRASELVSWLGPKRFYNELAERITAPGVVVGLAWTQAGGDILFIEALSFQGHGGLKLTGQMGEVMSESAAIAWSYVRKKALAELRLDRGFFRQNEFHLHIPAGAIPKDGPSAGVTMATALYGLLSGRKLKARLAMTGELSLIGKVLPVGGIKEKLLAARRAGITTVLLPKLNEKDMSEVPPYATKGMTLHFVGHVEDVFRLALEPTGKTLGSRRLPEVLKTARKAHSKKRPNRRPHAR